MIIHYDQQLSSLLAGELDGDETRVVVSHLRECGECTSSLISVAVAHGALRAARRSIAAPTSPLLAPSPLAPLVVPRRRAGRLVGLLAAALVVIAGTIGIVHSVSGTRATSVAAVAALHHLDSPTSASGEVTVHATALELRMLVSTKGLPMAPSDHFYEVWLLDPQTNKMLPLGVLSVSGTSTFTISRPLMSQFSAVDISLQDNNGSPQHSTISVLRGTVTAV
jgi:hypothetical protein